MNLLKLVHSCSRDVLDDVLQDTDTLNIIEKYSAYEEKVRGGHLGKTAVFWMSVIDHCHLLLL